MTENMTDTIQRLRVRIDSGEYADGARLPPERDLAADFGVSRAAVRKVMSVLEAEGRIWRHVGRGTFVGTRPPQDAPNLAAITRSTHPEEVIEVRLLLEPHIAGLAARRATAGDIEAMTRAIQRSKTAADVAEFELWDGAYHRAMAEAAHNTLLQGLFDAINAIRQEEIWGRLKEASLTGARKQAYIRQHTDCLDAIRDRDPGRAEALMRDHLETVKQNMFERAKAVAV
jgi:DNA-binding FadR family transcriptional regulator